MSKNQIELAEKKKRPLTVILLVVYATIVGTITGAAGVLALVVAAPEIPPMNLVPLVILGILMLAAAYGLWNLRRWGLRLGWGLWVLQVILVAIVSLSEEYGIDWAYASAMAVVWGMVALGPQVPLLWWITSEHETLFEFPSRKQQLGS